MFRYKLVLDSDAEEFGGHKRVQPDCEYVVDGMSYNDRPHSTLVRPPSLDFAWQIVMQFLFSFDQDMRVEKTLI